MAVAGGPARASTGRRKGGCPAIGLSTKPRRVSVSDGTRWQRLFGPLVERWAQLLPQLLGPVLSVPRHPLTLARFGVRGAAAGHAADSPLPDRRGQGPVRRVRGARDVVAVAPSDIGVRLDLGGVGPRRRMARRGGRFASGRRRPRQHGSGNWGSRYAPDRWCVRSPICHRIAWCCSIPTPRSSHRSPATPCLPAIASGCCSFATDPAPSRSTTPSTRRFRGSTTSACRAGTVHVIGTFAELVAAEADVAAGRMPDRPFVLVVQPTIFDPSRAPAGKHTLWVYAHVPHGYTRRCHGGDRAADRDGSRLGLRPPCSLVTSRRHAISTQYNANYVGGDIAGGAHSGAAVGVPPDDRCTPYSTPNPSLFLCSASTPPGAGVHGMCGWNAAERALLALK